MDDLLFSFLIDALIFCFWKIFTRIGALIINIVPYTISALSPSKSKTTSKTTLISPDGLTLSSIACFLVGVLTTGSLIYLLVIKN